MSNAELAPVSSFPRFFVGGNSPEAPDDAKFPLDALPAAARQFVSEIAAALPCPAEYAALPLLVAAGAVIGRSRTLELKQGWEQHPVLFGAIVGEPGAKKSPATGPIEKILAEIQAEAEDRHAAELAVYRATHDTPPDQIDPNEPRCNHVFTTDATMESVVQMAADSQGLVILKDELVGWVKANDMYRNGQGGDRQLWLSLWAAKAVKQDRKTKGLSVFARDPRVSVVGGIQPALLTELSHSATVDDGMLGRLLWTWPEDVPDEWTDEVIRDETIEAMAETVRKLRRWAGDGVVRLSPDALELWKVWQNENGQRAKGLTGVRKGMVSKLPAQAARLALILHCIDHPDGNLDIPPHTLNNALRLTEYFRSQAERILVHIQVAGSPEQGRRQLLMQRVMGMLDRAPNGVCTRSDLIDGLQHNTPAADLTSVLNELIGMGRVVEEQRTSGPKGGRPATVYRLASASEGAAA